MSVSVAHATAFVFLIIMGVAIYLPMRRVKRGIVPKIRPLAALRAIPEAIGRATETGRPVIVSPGGTGQLYSAEGPALMVGLAVVNHVSRLAARTGTQLVVAVQHPDVFAMASHLVSEAYRAEGKPEAFRPDIVRFLGGEQMAYTTGVLGIMQREKTASGIYVGQYSVECCIIGEAGHNANMIMIGGTSNMYQLPYLVTAYDFFLIGEEIYAAGAYLTQESRQLAAIRSADIIRFIVIGFIVSGLVLVNMGVTTLTTWLRS